MEASPNKIVNYKNPCPKCAKLALFMDKDEFEDKLHKINSNIELLEDYQANKIPIKCKCRLCGHIWSPRPYTLLQGTGCPECNHTSTSFVEQILLLSLRQVLGKKEVISRDKKTISNELDIFIPSKHYAIEYGAWFWHKNRLKNDQNRIKECEKKNIKLLCIYDACSENVTFENTITFREELSQNLDIVKKILSDIFLEINVKYSFSEEDWDKIREKAYIKSRKMTCPNCCKNKKEKNG